jgi:hypothetical protein
LAQWSGGGSTRRRRYDGISTRLGCAAQPTIQGSSKRRTTNVTQIFSAFFPELLTIEEKMKAFLAAIR